MTIPISRLLRAWRFATCSNASKPCSMHINEVEAIWLAIVERDDWQPFNNKVKAIRLMGEAMGQNARTS